MLSISSIRLWHGYIGILIAPSVIFFALTGSLQFFNLHEAHGNYVPPPLIGKLSAIHKDQVFEQAAHDEDSAGAEAKGDQPPPHEDRPALGTVLLKWFFLFVALALTTSTSLGLWIALTHPQRKLAGWCLLLLGIILPIALFII